MRSRVYDLQEPRLPIHDGRLSLSLEEALAIALERNLGLFVERHNRQESAFRIFENLGIYDINTFATVTATSETNPSTSNLDGADVRESKTQSADLGASRLFPVGGTLRLDYRNSRLKTNSLFATLNPSFRIDFDVTYTQPLLRNRGSLATERTLRIARTNLDISEETFEEQVTNLLRDVEAAYWDLVEAEEQLKVAEESLSLAKELHEQNRIRVDVGTLAPLELVQSEAGVATREEELIRARSAVGDAADVLRQLLNLPDPLAWSVPIEPVTEPEREPVEVDLREAITTALDKRPEIRRQKLTVSNLELDQKYFQNQLRPQLDLTVTYGVNGIGGDLTDRDFFTGQILEQRPGGYDDALNQIIDANFEGWRVQFDFAYPIENSTAKAQKAIADVSADRGRASLRDLELQVMTEVRRAARAVETAAESIESAKVSRRLEERNLEAEQKRYENGMSTSFQVLQIQEDLIEARSREVSAVTGYRKALSEYYRAIGRLLDENGVEILRDET